MTDGHMDLEKCVILTVRNFEEHSCFVISDKTV